MVISHYHRQFRETQQQTRKKNDVKMSIEWHWSCKNAHIVMCGAVLASSFWMISIWIEQVCTYTRQATHHWHAEKNGPSGLEGPSKTP